MIKNEVWYIDYEANEVVKDCNLSGISGKQSICRFYGEDYESPFYDYKKYMQAISLLPNAVRVLEKLSLIETEDQDLLLLVEEARYVLNNTERKTDEKLDY